MLRRCGVNTHWVQLTQGNDCVTSVDKWYYWQDETGVPARLLETFSRQNQIITGRPIHAKIDWSVRVHPTQIVGQIWLTGRGFSLAD